MKSAQFKTTNYLKRIEMSTIGIASDQSLQPLPRWAKTGKFCSANRKL